MTASSVFSLFQQTLKKTKSRPKRLNLAPKLLELRVVALLHPLEEAWLGRVIHQPSPVRQHAPHHLAVVALRVAVHVHALRLAHRYTSHSPLSLTEDDSVFLEHVDEPVEGGEVARADRHVVVPSQIRHVAEVDLSLTLFLRTHEVVVAILQRAHHDAVLQRVLELALRRDLSFQHRIGRLRVQVARARRLVVHLARVACHGVQLVEHAEETGQVQFPRVNTEMRRVQHPYGWLRYSNSE